MKKLLALGAVLFVLTAPACVAQTDLGVISLINGDVDGDNEVTTTDLSILLKNMGQTTVDGDLDGDSQVTSADLNILLKNIDLMGNW